MYTHILVILYTPFESKRALCTLYSRFEGANLQFTCHLLIPFEQINGIFAFTFINVSFSLCIAYTRVYISRSYLPLSLLFSPSLLVSAISTEEIEMCHFKRITSHLDYYCIEDGNKFLHAYPIPTRDFGAIQCAGIFCSPVIVQWNALTLLFSSSLHFFFSLCDSLLFFFTLCRHQQFGYFENYFTQFSVEYSYDGNVPIHVECCI